MKTVKLGTTIGNIGLEGVSYDPLTDGFIFVKEKDPESIFQTDIDFNAGTATNGSPSATSSTNLFDPTLANPADFSDVFALSNLPFLNGQADAASVPLLWPPNGKLVPDTISGTVTDAPSGVDPRSLAFRVVDEYGRVQPAGAITLDAGGRFSFAVSLEADRLGQDHDGRQYQVIISASDNAGNHTAASAIVTVPHDKGK